VKQKGNTSNERKIKKIERKKGGEKENDNKGRKEEKEKT
jgi:hypothetical protein